MGKINVLSFAVANLIAAGEVVDRPASVIKELMENAIDSGANRITVEIQNGGVVFMRVSDNGCGIERDDLSVAVRRHATSKIRDASDLDGILTLGFRGEALAAIAAVSDLRIISRVKGQQTGAVIEVSGGDILGVSERGCSEGTSVIVENLFGNVPARRKFLKKDVTETAAVHSVVEKIALSHPEIAFTFIADGNVKLQTVGDGKLLSTLYALYGREFAKSLIEVNYEYEGVRISGYTGRSDNVKPNRNSQNFFINTRLVKSRTVSAAVEQAYCSYIPVEKFAVCTLFIDINPKAVDVNVHPAKLEVKFSNEKPVFEAVYYGIKNALESNTTRPDIPPEKLSRMSYAEYQQLFTPKSTTETKQSPIPPKSVREITSSHIPAPELPSSQYYAPTEHTETYETAPKYSVQDYIEIHKKAGTDGTDQKSNEESVPKHEDELPKKQPETTDQLPTAKHNILANLDAPSATVEYKNSAQKSLSTTMQQSVDDGSIPQYRIIGEVFNSYILVESGDKMLLIDKHAAHERIIFEKLKAGLRNTETNSQLLMLPLEFMLTSDEVTTLSNYREEIEKIGFRFEAEKYTVSVSAVPETIELSAVPDMFMTIADRIKNETGNAGLTRDIMFEKALYQASCKAAIKAGREYGEEHIKWLVSQLMNIPDITFCPHGRPVAMEIKKSGLDRQFKRT